MKFNKFIDISGVQTYIPEHMTLEFDPENRKEKAKVLAAFALAKNVVEDIAYAGLFCEMDATKHSQLAWHITATQDGKAMIALECLTCNKKGIFAYDHRGNNESDAHLHMVKTVLNVMNDYSNEHYAHYITNLEKLKKFEKKKKFNT